MADVAPSGTPPAEVDVSGAITANTEWSPRLAGVYFIDGPLSVPAGVTLTIAPGTVIKSDVNWCDPTFGCGPYTPNISTSLVVDGTLNAIGTATSPITFTSVNDNTIGGSIGSGDPAEGDWAGILADDGGEVTLDDVAMDYPSIGVECNPGDDEPAVSLLDDSIANSDQGVDCSSGLATAVIADSSISAEGTPVVIGDSTGAVTIAGNSITQVASQSGGDGVDVSDSQGDVTVTGNSVSLAALGGEGDGIAVVWDDPSQALDAVVASNAVTMAQAGGYAYSVDSADLDFTSLLTNSFSGPAVDDVMSIGGTIATSQSWAPASYSWVIGDSYIDVPAGVTLTIAPGTVIKFVGLGLCEDWSAWGCDEYESMTVEGSLNSMGSSSDEVVMTSINDNSVGAALGSGSPKTGDWSGIQGSSTSSFDMQGTTIEYSSNGVDVSGGSGESVVLDSNNFVDNGTAVSISVSLTTNAQIDENSFVGNSQAIVAMSNWSTVSVSSDGAQLSCFFVPTIDATGNAFGSDGSTTPIVSPSDYAEIEDLLTEGNVASLFGASLVASYPSYLDGSSWTDQIQSGSTDTINVQYLPCVDVTDLASSYVAIATPLNLSGGIVVPIST